jgi:hypothetical protein
VSGRKATAELLELLRTRVLGPEGQGARAVFLDEVRGGTGFSSGRTIDAVTIGMWPSRGCLIEGYELKQDRGDWRGELNDPSKAEEIAQHCDRFWLVTTKGIAEADEVPPNWGWLERDGNRKRLICKREATPLDGPGPSATFVAAMLRRAVKADLARELKAHKKDLDADAHRKIEVKTEASRNEVARLENELAEYRRVWSAFREKAGINLPFWIDKEEAIELVGEVVAALLRGKGRESLRGRIKSTIRDLDGAKERFTEVLEKLGGDDEDEGPMLSA